MKKTTYFILLLIAAGFIALYIEPLISDALKGYSNFIFESFGNDMEKSGVIERFDNPPDFFDVGNPDAEIQYDFYEGNYPGYFVSGATAVESVCDEAGPFYKEVVINTDDLFLYRNATDSLPTGTIIQLSPTSSISDHDLVVEIYNCYGSGISVQVNHK